MVKRLIGGIGIYHELTSSTVNGRVTRLKEREREILGGQLERVWWPKGFVGCHRDNNNWVNDRHFGHLKCLFSMHTAYYIPELGDLRLLRLNNTMSVSRKQNPSNSSFVIMGSNTRSCKGYELMWANRLLTCIHFPHIHEQWTWPNRMTVFQTNQWITTFVVFYLRWMVVWLVEFSYRCGILISLTMTN